MLPVPSIWTRTLGPTVTFEAPLPRGFAEDLGDLVPVGIGDPQLPGIGAIQLTSHGNSLGAVQTGDRARHEQLVTGLLAYLLSGLPPSAVPHHPQGGKGARS